MDIAFAREIRRQLDDWRDRGLPGHDGYLAAAHRLTNWRRRHGTAGLWRRPPTLVTATLDDAMGHGLAVIEAVAEAAGLNVLPLGVMRSVETIAGACRRTRPDLLGLTVLQFDTEPDLADLCRRLPPKTRVVAGGPVFTGDPELAQRCGVHASPRHAAAFLAYLLSFEPAVNAGASEEAMP
jgi:methylmalonyl-CoA mutase cobalamin-binding subunit